jgi:hypothetical protein
MLLSSAHSPSGPSRQLRYVHHRDPERTEGYFRLTIADCRLGTAEHVSIGLSGRRGRPACLPRIGLGCIGSADGPLPRPLSSARGGLGEGSRGPDTASDEVKTRQGSSEEALSRLHTSILMYLHVEVRTMKERREQDAEQRWQRHQAVLRLSHLRYQKLQKERQDGFVEWDTVAELNRIRAERDRDILRGFSIEEN